MERVHKQDNETANRQRAVQRKLVSESKCSGQTNWINSSPAMVAQRKKLNRLFGSAIQRLEEEPLQRKSETVQRVEEEEPLQGKFETAQRAEEEEPLQGKFEPGSTAQLKEESAAKPNNTGLPDNLKNGIESLSGMSMEHVNVHYNSSQPAQLNALAYAQGTDIHVAPGQEQHLPHEAWHVVQQAQGRVQPTMQMKDGVPVNNDQSLEHEADVMGESALQMKGVVSGKRGLPPNEYTVPDFPMRPILQGEFEEKKKNNTSDMRALMKTHRTAEGKWNKTGCQKNFAVNVDNTATYGFSDEGGHSERNLLVAMLPRHSIGDPVNIHTERETCISCYELLKKTHDDVDGTVNAFDMNISYTVKYPGDGDSKDKLYEYYNTKSDMP